MAIDTQNLQVTFKSYARAKALPLDKDEVWESLEAAQAYASSATAYPGQTIKVLVDGKYIPYTLQPGENKELSLEQSGGAIEPQDEEVLIVKGLPTEGQLEDVIYIDALDNYDASIWNGEEYIKIFGKSSEITITEF